MQLVLTLLISEFNGMIKEPDYGTASQTAIHAFTSVKEKIWKLIDKDLTDYQAHVLILMLNKAGIMLR